MFYFLMKNKFDFNTNPIDIIQKKRYYKNMLIKIAMRQSKIKVINRENQSQAEN